MTKRLDPKEKERRKKERKKKKRDERRKQKAAAVTSAPIGTNKPDTPPEDTTKPQDMPPPADVNLCDDCAYEFGECEGVPKFASDFDPELKGAEADRVVQCPKFLNVAEMPTEDQKTIPGPAACLAAPSEPSKEPPEEPPEDQGPDEEDEGELTPEVEARLKTIREDLPARPDPKRFEMEEDFGTCQSCTRPLKRTAFNRYNDAVRCTNPRCRAYRAVVKTVPTGV